MDRDPKPKVELRRVACVRFRHARAGCRRCLDACPGHALSLRHGQPVSDQSSCQACGACEAACPTGAIRVRGGVAATLERRPPEPGLPLSLACAQAAEGSDGETRIGCLSGLDEETLAGLAARAASVTLVRGECAGCPRAGRPAEFRALIERAERLLELAGTKQPVPMTLISRPGGVGLGRRLFLRRLLGPERPPEPTPADQGPCLDYFVNPLGECPEQAAPPRRVRLIEGLRKRLADRGQDDPMPPDTAAFPAPRLNAAACLACGVCALVCPTGALRLARPPSQGTRIVAAADRCVGCGACLDACFANALSLVRIPLSALLAAGAETVLSRGGEEDQGLAEWENKIGQLLGDVPVHRT